MTRQVEKAKVPTRSIHVLCTARLGSSEVDGAVGRCGILKERCDVNDGELNHLHLMRRISQSGAPRLHDNTPTIKETHGIPLWSFQMTRQSVLFGTYISTQLYYNYDHINSVDQRSKIQSVVEQGSPVSLTTSSRTDSLKQGILRSRV